MFRKLCLLVLKYIDFCVLLVGLVITLSFWFWSARVESNTNALKSAVLDQKTSELNHEMQVYVDHVWSGLHSIKGLYLGSEEVTNQELLRFIVSLNHNGNMKVVPKISFVKALPIDEISKFETDNKISKPIEIDNSHAIQFIEWQEIDVEKKTVNFSGRNLWQSVEEADLINKLLVAKKPLVMRVEDENWGEGFIFSDLLYDEVGLVGLVNAFVPKDVIESEIWRILDKEVYWEWSINSDLVSKSRDRDPDDSYVDNSFTLSVAENSSWNIRLFEKSEKNITGSGMFVLVGVITSFVSFVIVHMLSLFGMRTSRENDGMTIDLLQYKKAIDSSSNHIVITDKEGVVKYANDAACKMTGFDRKDMVGQTPRLWGGQMGEAFYRDMWHVIKTEKRVFTGEIKNIRKNGEFYDAEVTISPILDVISGDLTGFVGIESDVTNRKKADMELKRAIELMVGRELKMAELKQEIKKLTQEPKT